MEEDLHALITPKQIAEFERSQAARNAICLFGQLSGAHCLDMTQANYTIFCCFRFQLIMPTGLEPLNMKMGELNSAVKHDDEYVVHVSDQKTFIPHTVQREQYSARNCTVGWPFL